jgi:hypothetical protein
MDSKAVTELKFLKYRETRLREIRDRLKIINLKLFWHKKKFCFRTIRKKYKKRRFKLR